MRKLMAVGVTALALAGCGSDEPASTSSGGGGGSGTTAVALQDNTFAPATIKGSPGSTVKLKLTNEGQAEHTFTVDSQQIDTELESGDSASVSVTIPKSGSVEFYCRYHRAGGMVGTLGAGSAPAENGSKGMGY